MMTSPTSQASQARDRIKRWLSACAGGYVVLKLKTQAQLLDVVRNTSLVWTERGVAIGILVLSSKQPPELPAILRAIVQDEKDADYVRLDAALALAMLGGSEPAAIEVLRRVLAPRSFFALTQSNMERGAACLGLALLGDEASRPQIIDVQRFPINGNGDDATLALQLLDLAATTVRS